MGRSLLSPRRGHAALMLPALLLCGCDTLGDFEEEKPWLTATPNGITVVEGRVVDVEVNTNISLHVWDMGVGSDDQSVALVDSVDVTGEYRAIAHVQGIGPGSTKMYFGIHAVRQHASASIWVTVKPVTVRSLSLLPDSLTVAPGADFWIMAHAKDSVGCELVGQPIEWRTSDSTVVFLQVVSDLTWNAKFETAGSALFRADKPGMVEITAALEGIHTSSVVYVTEF